MNIIEIKNLAKKFNGAAAVDGISFEVKSGEIFGFLGPNGAGKSTTISMLSTILTPTSGEAFVNNFNILTQKNEVRKSIGLVFQDSSLDDQLTAEENLRFHAKLYHVPEKEYKKRMEEVLRLVDLWDKKKSIIKTFSGGMKRRLEIARGLIHYPKVLFLDEPTLGLDPQTRARLWEYILLLKRERKMTIFMTTHYMNEAEYCDRIAIIDRGKIVALDTPANLKKMVGGDIIRMTSAKKDALKEELKQRYHNCRSSSIYTFSHRAICRHQHTSCYHSAAFDIYASLVIRHFRHGTFYRLPYENNGKLRASYASAHLSDVFSFGRFLSSHRRAPLDVHNLKD